MGTLDTKSPEFWDLAAVDKELRRVYDICGGCRRCLPLCPSFKVLFDRLDVDAVDGDHDQPAAEDLERRGAEEHTSELHSPHYPVCPPQLEKKKLLHLERQAALALAH